MRPDTGKPVETLQESDYEGKNSTVESNMKKNMRHSGNRLLIRCGKWIGTEKNLLINTSFWPEKVQLLRYSYFS